jgi:CRP/FNR family transcriptional regulator
MGPALAGFDADNTVTRSQLAGLLPEFSRADEAPLVELLAASQVVTMKRDDFVFRLGDMCEAFLILLDGRVRVQLISSSGREVTLYRINPGGSCILTTSCLLSDEHYPAEAIAESDLSALAIPTAGFQSALESSSGFRKLVFDGFSSRLAGIIRKIEEIAFTSIDTRLASVLLRLDDEGVQEVTHQDIAVELGTAREVVSRHLKRLEAAGSVQLGRGRIGITDRSQIEAIATSTVGD